MSREIRIITISLLTCMHDNLALIALIADNCHSFINILIDITVLLLRLLFSQIRTFSGKHIYCQ